MTRSRYRIWEQEQPHFLTSTIVGWLPIFTRPETVEIVLDSWRFLQSHQRIKLFGYVILENHLHWIASSPDLGKEVGDFKSYTARKIVDLLETQNVHMLLNQLRNLKLQHKIDREYQLWQEGSHPQQIQSREVMLQKLEYMHDNPVKRGYVDEPVHWRYSSARNYHNMGGLIEVVTEW